jgi:Tfp pilus assembly protein PilW
MMARDTRIEKTTKENDMRLKTFVSLVLVALAAGVPLACSGAATLHNEISHHEVSRPDPDPISGEWEVSFYVQGTTTPATFKLKLDGNKVTGTAESAHTGPGTVRDGSWTENKLSFTLDFENHESIAITGGLKDGKLSGEFRTEGFVEKWEATKKGPQPQATPSATTSADPISGEWEAAFEAQGSKAPVTFKLKLDGNKLSGTSASSHLGSGTLSDGSWVDGKLSFTMNGAHGSIAVKGTLKEGQLSGVFDAGQFKGTWQANRK